jgi:ParB-like chromosome segregation protein Spo0J
MNYEIHPICEIFPELPDNEFQALKADIAKNGVLNYGLLYEGKVLDGRHRYRACLELGKEMVFGEVDEDDKDFDPLAYVLSSNFYRRHLNESQRGMVGARLRDMFDKEAKGRQGKRTDIKENLPECPKGQSRDLAGKAVKVSGKTIDNATTVLKKGSEELIKAVDSGEVSVSKAAKVAKTTPKQEQAQRATEKQKARDAIQAEREAVEAWVRRFERFENRMYAVKELIGVLEPTEKGIVAALCEE